MRCAARPAAPARAAGPQHCARSWRTGQSTRASLASAAGGPGQGGGGGCGRGRLLCALRVPCSAGRRRLFPLPSALDPLPTPPSPRPSALPPGCCSQPPRPPHDCHAPCPPARLAVRCKRRAGDGKVGKEGACAAKLPVAPPAPRPPPDNKKTYAHTYPLPCCLDFRGARCGWQGAGAGEAGADQQEAQERLFVEGGGCSGWRAGGVGWLNRRWARLSRATSSSLERLRGCCGGTARLPCGARRQAGGKRWRRSIGSVLPRVCGVSKAPPPRSLLPSATAQARLFAANAPTCASILLLSSSILRSLHCRALARCAKALKTGG